MLKKTVRIPFFFLASLLLAALLSAFPARAADKAPIALGDTVTMGVYEGSPIVWRCVAFEKIAGYDASGNPVVDSTDTVTEYADGYLPLMFADAVLCQKVFDAAGTDISGSHGRGWCDPDGHYPVDDPDDVDYGVHPLGCFRQKHGSDYWGDSNLRCWLNSSASAGNVVWSCGNPPTGEKVMYGEGYADEAGFLNAFSPEEIPFIRKVVQKAFRGPYEDNIGSNNLSDPNFITVAAPPVFAENYASASCDWFADLVFIPDVRQIKNVYENREVLGEECWCADWVEGYGEYDFWLRTPAGGSCGGGVCLIGSDNLLLSDDADAPDGVRPAFFLNVEMLPEIVINSLPEKTEYAAYDVFDPAGLAVRAVWPDGTEKDMEISDLVLSIPAGTVLYPGDYAVSAGYDTGIGLVVSSSFEISVSGTGFSPIELGETIELGYYPDRLVWRCVSFERIVGYDGNGDPVVDSTDAVKEYKDGYLPLMLADSIVDGMPFDEYGTDVSASHGRGRYVHGKTGDARIHYGSNYWGDSNLRCWLNSDSPAGEVVWSCGNPPEETRLYAEELKNVAGFLRFFTADEKTFIRPVVQRSLLTKYESNTGKGNVRRTDYHLYSSSVSSAAGNYASAYCEWLTDAVFLPDVRQIQTVYENGDVLGEDYYIGKTVDVFCGETRIDPAAFWLRTPKGDSDSEVLLIDAEGNVRFCCAEGWSKEIDMSSGGVRPAFYLDIQTVFLREIRIGSLPEKNAYRFGESFSLDGLSVSAVYSDGTEKDVSLSDLSLSIPDGTSLYPGDYTVSLNYTDGARTASASFPITVSGIGSVPVSLGETITLGSYGGKPVVWRCVAFERIAGFDENGDPVVDSTDTVTEYKDGYLPLMLVDEVLCGKAFDAAGTDVSGSHGRGNGPEDDPGAYRRQNGSNYWGDSNLRDWLNSSSPAGGVVWSCGNPPDYAGEAGFLNAFTAAETGRIRKVSQKLLLTGPEGINLDPVGGHPSVMDSAYFVSIAEGNYRVAYCEQTTDAVFLLDERQVQTVYENGGLLGESYYKETNGYDFLWLRSPSGYYEESYVRIVYYGNLYNSYPDDRRGGVRPAFFLDLSAAVSVRGDADSSGVCDVFDAVAVLSYVVDPEKNPLSSGQLLSADADGSGAVDVFDAVEILTYIVNGKWSEKTGAGFASGPQLTDNGINLTLNFQTDFDGTVLVYFTNEDSAPDFFRGKNTV